ncbi:hypothetical protein [Spiroplasma turonicum]|uniref:Uncharacterized protein n=1 Tax=Spiroplasma turonicum TaxID=216946 RepID=A0A0K1P5H2_9MOLU|nr:hypothetical protein [Spiroplasma turonicum]AKU79533.1 hypothetical protein STURON_00287 [Spiroplasma turonicum]ALX70556.1 hypothetical protein STURO_v1c02880 [Spiroplasma turonicum]
MAKSKNFKELLDNLLKTESFSYFTIFNINKNDLEKVFDSLILVSEKIYDYKNFLLKKIRDKYIYFSENIFSEGHFRKAESKEELQENKAFINSLLITATRILACLYNQVHENENYMNINRLEIPNFGNDKYDIKSYKESLFCFLNSLLKWSQYFIDFNDNNNINYITQIDDYINVAVSKIRLFKSLFILIWIYGVVEKAIYVHEYCSSLSSTKDGYSISNIFQSNVLEPIGVNKIIDNSNHSLNVAIKNNFNAHKIESLRNNFYKSVINKINEKNIVEYSFNDYINIIEKISSSFSFFNSYEKNRYFDSLFNILSNTTNFDKGVNLIKDITYKHIYHQNKDLTFANLIKTKPDLGQFKQLIFKHKIKDYKTTFYSFPEFINLSLNLQKQELFTYVEDEIVSKQIVHDSLRETVESFFTTLKFKNPNFLFNDITQLKVKPIKRENDLNYEGTFDFAIINKSNKVLYLIKCIGMKSYKNLFSSVTNDVYLGSRFNEFCEKNIFAPYELYTKNWNKFKKQLNFKDILRVEFLIVSDEENKYFVTKKVEGMNVHVIKYDDLDYFFRSYILKEISILD